MNEKESCEKIVPISIIDSVPNQQDTRIDLCTGYVSKKEITRFAELKGTRGITINDLQQTKKNAQRRLKYFCNLGVLFTARDLINQGIELPPNFRNHRPQRYYPTSKKSEIIEKIKNEYKNVLLTTTGTPNSVYPLFQNIEKQKANSFLEILQRAHFSPTYIHKINLMLSVGKDNYKEISQYLRRPIGQKEEIIGKRHVTYIYHANGTVQIFVISNKYPVKLQNHDDVNVFFSLIGQVKDRMIFHMEDRWERIVPPVNNWILKQCDINNDIPISDKAQIYLPDLELKIAGRVFRMYVKSLEGNSVGRVEDSKEVNQPLSSFRDLLEPDQTILQTIQNLSDKIDNLCRAQRCQTLNPYAIPIF